MGQAILVLGVGTFDVRFGLLQSGLAELHDGTESQIVAGLCQVKGQIRLLAELPGDKKTFVGPASVLPRVTHIPGNVISQIRQSLAICVRL